MTSTTTDAAYPPWNGTFGDPNGLMDENGLNVYNANAPLNRTAQVFGFIISIVGMGGSMAIIIIRAIVSARKRRGRPTASDWTLIAALPLILFKWFGDLVKMSFGVGLYSENIKNRDNIYWIWLSDFAYRVFFLIIVLVKISICQALLTLIPPSGFRKYRYTLYGMITVNALLGVIITIVWNLSCKPYICNFSATVACDVCIDTRIVRSVWFSLGLLTDVLLVLIPILLLRQAKHLHIQDKRILHVIYGTTFVGTLACASNIVVVTYMVYYVYPYEPTMTQLYLIYVNSIEIFMYVLGGSLPVLAPYIVGWFRKRNSEEVMETRNIAMPTWLRKYKAESEEKARAKVSSKRSDESELLKSHGTQVAVEDA